jgi:hypothetical protein
LIILEFSSVSNCAPAGIEVASIATAAKTFTIAFIG